MLSECTDAVKQWYLCNHLLLNADKSEVVAFGTAYQLKSAAQIDTVSVAGAKLHVSSELKSLGVILDQRLSFDQHANMVVKACNYHTWAIRHIRPLLTQSTALTLACSLINSRLDYCNSLLNGAPALTISRLQRAQNNAAHAVLQADRRASSEPLLEKLHWLPVRQRIVYKSAMITYKVRITSVPAYLNCLLTQRSVPRVTRSSMLPLLVIPAVKTQFASRAFSYFAPHIWNSLPAEVITCDCLSTFKRRLKTYLFRDCFKTEQFVGTA